VYGNLTVRSLAASRVAERAPSAATTSRALITLEETPPACGLELETFEGSPSAFKLEPETLEVSPPDFELDSETLAGEVWDEFLEGVPPAFEFKPGPLEGEVWDEGLEGSPPAFELEPETLAEFWDEGGAGGVAEATGARVRVARAPNESVCGSFGNETPACAE
jgi:hypothetical protein